MLNKWQRVCKPGRALRTQRFAASFDLGFAVQTSVGVRRGSPASLLSQVVTAQERC